MSDPLSYLFARPNAKGNLLTLSPYQLDEIRTFLNHEHGGANIIYLENTDKTPFVSRLFKNGIEYNFDTSDNEEKKLVLSACPAQDSIELAKQRHFKDHYVGYMCSPELKFYVPTYESGTSAYLALDRYPNGGPTFKGIVQADPLWKEKAQRRKVLKNAYDAVCLYSGDKRRSSTSHPHMGYQFFFGHHNAYGGTVRTYVPRVAGAGFDQVSLTTLSLCVHYISKTQTQLLF